MLEASEAADARALNQSTIAFWRCFGNVNGSEATVSQSRDLRGLRHKDEDLSFLLDGDGLVRRPADQVTQLGELLEACNQFQDAMEYYKAAIQIDRTWSIAAFRLGNLAMKIKDHRAAEHALDLALESLPDHAPTLYLAGCNKAALGKHEEALSLLQRALQHDRNHIGALLQCVRSLSVLERWREVIVTCSELLERLPDAKEARLWQLLAEVRIGKIADASTSYACISPKVKRRFASIAKQIEEALVEQGVQTREDGVCKEE